MATSIFGYAPPKEGACIAVGADVDGLMDVQILRLPDRMTNTDIAWWETIFERWRRPGLLFEDTREHEFDTNPPRGQHCRFIET